MSFRDRAVTGFLWAAACTGCARGQAPVLATTVQPLTLTPAAAPPGARVRLGYAWGAEEPTAVAYTVFVHFRDATGHLALQADHSPPVGTSTPGWRGRVRYERSLVLPADLSPGCYRIVLGLYRRSERAQLQAGPGVRDLGGGAYEVATLRVDPNAPWPPPDTAGVASLDLSGYTCTFSEEFDGPLDVSAWGPGTRWIAHTPWAGDFGDAAFADPGPGFPFRVRDGVLCIEARRDPNVPDTAPKRRRWRSGLLASNDPRGRGFSQRYGYFEIRAQLPPGPGVWPAFWLCSSYDRKDPNAGADGSVEIDVFEYYGRTPSSFTATIHTWKPGPHRSVGATVTTPPQGPSTDFHRYGCLVEPREIRCYYDGVEVWHGPTPAAHNKPLMVLLNLALGPGWPIDETPSPSIMRVDYVRVYAPPGGF